MLNNLLYVIIIIVGVYMVITALNVFFMFCLQDIFTKHDESTAKEKAIKATFRYSILITILLLVAYCYARR